MKKNFFSWLTLALLTVVAMAFSMNMPARKPIPVSISVMKSLTDPLGYKNYIVVVAISIKDTNGDIVYGEFQTLALNELAEAKINVGEGSTQVPAFDSADLKKATKLCYTITVLDPGGNNVVLMGEEPFGQQAFSVQSETAESANNADNANAVGNVAWGSEKVSPMELFVPPGDVTFCVPVVRKVPLITAKPTFRQLLMRDYVRADTKPSEVNDEPIDYLCIGTGNPCPWLFGNKNVAKIENFYTVYTGQMTNYNNGLAVIVANQQQPIGHTSAAIYAKHNEDAQGTGIYANGRLTGSYNAGRTGVFGLCNNTTGNGAALSGVVQFDAATGFGNYALYATANNRANSYAAYLDGDMYITGSTMGPSDRALKTDIRTTALGLSTVLQLRPTSFRYLESTTFSFPDGEHHGFIAQEMEAVIPSLVRDMNLPMSPEPEKMSECGTITIKSINYIEMIPILTKAIQELNDKVDAQAEEIIKLKTELIACKPK